MYHHELNERITSKNEPGHSPDALLLEALTTMSMGAAAGGATIGSKLAVDAFAFKESSPIFAMNWNTLEPEVTGRSTMLKKAWLEVSPSAEFARTTAKQGMHYFEKLDQLGPSLSRPQASWAKGMSEWYLRRVVDHYQREGTDLLRQAERPLTYGAGRNLLRGMGEAAMVALLTSGVERFISREAELAFGENQFSKFMRPSISTSALTAAGYALGWDTRSRIVLGAAGYLGSKLYNYYYG